MSGEPHPDVRALASQVIGVCLARGWRIATAESCTGGLAASALTDVAGSSAVFDRGFVTYSNAAKSDMLGVDARVIETFGAVSRETARAMAAGALERSRATLAVSITGIAGPGGGSAVKPVGLVHVAVATATGGLDHRECRFGAIGREGVRAASVLTALAMLLSAAENGGSG